MKSKHSQNQKREKKKHEKNLSHKELLEKLSGLEVHLEKKKTDEEMEKGEKSKQDLEDIHDLNFNGIDFNSQLRQILSFNRQNIPQREILISGGELEGAVASAPRISQAAPRQDESRKLDYSKNAYDTDPYKEKPSDYESKTPDYAAGPSGTNREAGGRESGTGIGFETRAGRSSSGENGNGGN